MWSSIRVRSNLLLLPSCVAWIELTSVTSARENVRSIRWVHSHLRHGVGMSQEIPEPFSAETGWPGEDDCALMTSITTPKEWPLQVRRIESGVLPGISAVSVGAGWARFIAEQDLGLGAFLTFEVVDDRRLVVAVHQRCAAPDFKPLTPQPDVSSGVVRDSERETPAVDERHRSWSNVLPDVRSEDRPQFHKTLRKTHLKKQDSSRFVSANPNGYIVLCGSFIVTHYGSSGYL